VRFYDDGGGTRTGLGSFSGHSMGDSCIRGKSLSVGLLLVIAKSRMGL
jgi:hypothetical protein